MSDRSTNERLFRKATRESLLGEPGETKSTEVVPTPRVSRSISPLMLAVVTGLDLVAALVLLTVSFTTGLVMFVISSAVLGRWLNTRGRVTSGKRGVADD